MKTQITNLLAKRGLHTPPCYSHVILSVFMLFTLLMPVKVWGGEYTGDLYITGTNTNAGWIDNLSDDYKFTNAGNGIYYWYGFFKNVSGAEDGFKFLKGKNWCNYGSYGPRDASESVDGHSDQRRCSITMTDYNTVYPLEKRNNCDGLDKKFRSTANQGFYMLLIDLSDEDNGTMKVLPGPCYLYAVGTGIHTNEGKTVGWNAGSSIAMKHAADGVLWGKYYITSGGEFKFLMQQSFGKMWGPTGRPTFSGVGANGYAAYEVGYSSNDNDDERGGDRKWSAGTTGFFNIVYNIYDGKAYFYPTTIYLDVNGERTAMNLGEDGWYTCTHDIPASSTFFFRLANDNNAKTFGASSANRAVDTQNQDVSMNLEGANQWKVASGKKVTSLKVNLATKRLIITGIENAAAAPSTTWYISNGNRQSAQFTQQETGVYKSAAITLGSGDYTNFFIWDGTKSYMDVADGNHDINANTQYNLVQTSNQGVRMSIAGGSYYVTVNTNTGKFIVEPTRVTVSGDYSLRGDLWLNGSGWKDGNSSGVPHFIKSNDETTASVSYVMPVAQARLTLCKDGNAIQNDIWDATRSTLNKTSWNEAADKKQYYIAPQSSVKKYTFTYDAATNKLYGTYSDYDVVKAGWDVYIDNNKVGTTDANGEYTTSSPLSDKTYTIYLRKSGATSEIQGINWFGGLYIDKTSSNVNWDGEGLVYYDEAKFSSTKFPINGTTDAKGKFVLSSSSNIRVTFDGGKITINKVVVPTEKYYVMGGGNNDDFPNWNKDKKFEMTYNSATQEYTYLFNNVQGTKYFKVYNQNKEEYKGNLITPFETEKKNEVLRIFKTDNTQNNIEIKVEALANVTIHYKPTNPSNNQIWVTAVKADIPLAGEEWYIMGGGGPNSLDWNQNNMMNMDGDPHHMSITNNIAQITYSNCQKTSFQMKVFRGRDKMEIGCQYMDASSCRGLVMSHDNGAGDDNINVKSIPAGSNVNFFFDGTKIWGTATHTVTFVTNGGSEVAPREVVHNERITEASIKSEKQGATPTWYTDEACTQRFDFNTPITANTTLYAKWGISGNFYLVGNLWKNGDNEKDFIQDGTRLKMTVTNGVASFSYIAPKGRNRVYICSTSSKDSKLPLAKDPASPITLNDDGDYLSFTLTKAQKVTIEYDGLMRVKAEDYPIQHEDGWYFTVNKTLGDIPGDWKKPNSQPAAKKLDPATGVLYARDVNSGNNYDMKLFRSAGDAEIVGVGCFNALYVDYDYTPRGVTYSKVTNNDLNTSVSQDGQRWRDLRINVPSTMDLKISFDGGTWLVEEAPKYTITYVNGETIHSTPQVYEGRTAENIVLVDENSTFLGWYKDGEPYNFETPVTEDITLTARWNNEHLTFDARYVLSGDFSHWSNTANELTKVSDYEQSITYRFRPQLYINNAQNNTYYPSCDDGKTQRVKIFTYGSWENQINYTMIDDATSSYTEGCDTEQNNRDGRMWIKVTEPTDVTFTVWKNSKGNMRVSIVAVPAPKHTITYYANGAASGTVPTDGTQYFDGSSVTVLGNTGNLAKVGYTFGGWNTKADGSGTAYAAGDRFNIAADTKLYAQWTPNNPGVVTISGAYHIFTGETLTLTASVQNELPATGVTYTWKLGGQAIQGQNTATLTINNVSYSNAGSYTCTVDNHGASSTSADHKVKMLILYLKDNGANDLNNYTFVRDAGTNTAYADIELHENTTYKFSVVDRVGNAYGNSEMMTDQNHTNWDLDVDQDCRIQTTTTGTYRFRIDYNDLVHLKMTVDYPVYNQAAGHPIYFDKGTLNWSNVHYRIGAATTITGDQSMQPVPGTARLYQTTTKEYNGYLAWHLANNCGWTNNTQSDTKYSIYKTNTNSDQYAITQSTEFLRTNVGEQGVTVRCTDDHSTGTDAQNNNCEFYSTTVTSGLLTHNVTVENYTHGTITLAWTDINGQSQSSHVSTNGLAHTCLLTITAVPDDGCRLGSLTVGGQAFTSGQTLTLENDVTISVDFVLERTVHFETNGGSAIADVVIRDGQTIGTKSTTRDNCVFLGWYSDAALTTPFDIENDRITTNCTLYAKWRVPFTPGEKLYFSSEGTDWSNANAHICALFYKVDDLEYCLNTNSTNRNSAYFDAVNLSGAQSGLYANATKMTRLNGSNWYEVTVPYDNAGAVRLIRISSTDTQYMWAFAQRKDAEDRQGASTIKLTNNENHGATSVWVDDAPFCTISFEVFGHADAVSAVNDLAKGGSLPSLPRVNNIAAGYTFDGWYLENTYETPVTTDTKFAKTSTVYAKFRYTTSTSLWSQISPAPIASDVVVLTGSCTVDVNTAVATDVLLAPDVTLTIQPRGALTLTGRVLLQDAGGNTSAVNDPSRILIQSSATGTGTLIHGDQIGQTMATVALYSKAYSVKNPETGKTKKYWQYIGIPVERIMALDGFSNAMTYQYDETAGWIKKTSYEDLENFWGIGLTFNGDPGHTYTLPGTLASTAEKQIPLTYTGGVGEGMHLIGNSWTAPIQIDRFTDEDFGEAEKTIYIYNTGRDDEGGAGQGSSPGQWTAIPIKLSQHPNSVWAGPKVIPAMQAFEVNTNNPTTLTLNYDRLVRGQRTEDINTPLYTPSRVAEQDAISMMRISVAEEETMTNTDIYLVEGAGFSTGYDDGWDGRYSECDDRSAAFYSLSEEGNMAVNALPELEGNVLGFVPNKSRVYTISFGYDGQETYYLNDLQARQSTLIEEGSTYMFVAGDGDMVERFAISKTPLRAPGITTGVDDTEAGTWVQKVIVEDNLYIIRDGHMYNATGVMVK